MYNEYFGLSQAPFRITPDTALFYTGGNRGDVLDALVYAITSGEGIVKVVGEVGTGKTMLCRMLEERLPDNVQIAYLANPSLTPEDILHAVALELELDVASNANRLQVMHRLQETLLARHANNQRVVVLVEEAQSMPVDTLEEIRLLSNLETKNEKLLQIVLFGQPELDENLAKPQIRQLRERITHSFALTPLGRDEVKDYVAFRLRASGYRGRDAFTADAYRAMSRASQGLTRRVNIIADKAMLAAFADDTHDVSAKHVRSAIADSEFSASRVRKREAPLLALAVVAVLVAGVAGVAGWFAGNQAGTVAVRVNEPVRAARAPQPTVAPVASPAPAADPIPAQATRQAATSSAEPAVDSAPSSATAVLALAATQADGAQAASRDAPVPADVAADAAPARAADVPAAAIAAPNAVAPARGPETTLAVSPPASAPPLKMSMPKMTAGDPAPVSAAVAAAPADRPGADGAVANARSSNRSSLSLSSSPGPSPGASPGPPPEPAGSAVAIAPRKDAVAAPVGVMAAPAEQAPAATGAAGAAPVRPPEQTLLQWRLAQTDAWLRSDARDNYSIQLLATDAGRRHNLEAFLVRRERAGHIGKIFVYRTRINAREWFGVLFGEFASYTQAREALRELPSELQVHQPFIRNIRDIKALG